MRSLRKLSTAVQVAVFCTAQSTSVFLRDIGRGMLEISHNAFALFGLLVAAALIFTAGRDDLRLGAESEVLN
ncbi:MAG: hypothetical protein OEY03_15845, partial [Rhizobacter sp.]|nr:hypothetical protein [Rhizobacter sp.]